MEFSCTAANSELLIYVINGTSALNPMYDHDSKGFTVSEETLDMNKIRSNLTLASATADINNTEIYCTAGTIGVSFVDSDTALLKIQG